MKTTYTFRSKGLWISLIAALLFCGELLAAPGDTTWVTVWNLRKLTQHGNYDTMAVFPTNKRYRKIRMHYILGRYACPASAQYCGSWDYTTQIFAMPKVKDTCEIARVITPYATDWLQMNKSHDYIVDITDYASILEDSTAMRFRYDGYSWGFTITLKIEFIEGVPPMDAISVHKIYNGFFPYGNSNNSIENYLTAQTFSYSAPVKKLFLKNSVSGHGADNQNCSEFCSKYYTVHLNGNTIAQKQLWRNDCGYNQVYPQTGTWVYDRANWCPGAVVLPIYHDLSGLTSQNTTFTMDLNMQTYVNLNPSGGYIFFSHYIGYSDPNHQVDVAIEDIVSPTTDANYARNNTTCMDPVIKVRNTGSLSVNSIVFSYGLQGQTPITYTWTGTMVFLEEQNITLPFAAAMLSSTTQATFEVSVTSVNGGTGDENLFNNIYTSTFKPAQIIPSSFVIKMMTNKNGYENSWTLYDESGTGILSRNNLSANTAYIDTVRDLFPGCYRMEMIDQGCNGMQWWAAPAQGTGSLRIDRINANNTHFAFPADVGCGYTKYFVVLPPPPDTTGVSTYQLNPDQFEVVPNPASSLAYLRLDLGRRQEVRFQVTDLHGRLIMENTREVEAFSNVPFSIDALGNGVYLVKVTLGDGTTGTRKLVVEK